MWQEAESRDRNWKRENGKWEERGLVTRDLVTGEIKSGTDIVVRLSVPEWEEMGYTPVVFVRVANKGLTGYVKWKSVEVVENNGAGKWKSENGNWPEEEGRM